MNQFVINASLLLGAVVIVVLCRRSDLAKYRKPRMALQAGGIYSISNGVGQYGIAKLLVLDGGTCHVRIYKQKFPSRPKNIDASKLSLGKPGDLDGFGMGHLALHESAFVKWQPRLITMAAVVPDELKDYEIWQKNADF